MVILRHYFKIRPRTEGFRLRRTVSIGDDILSFLVRGARLPRAGRPGRPRP